MIIKELHLKNFGRFSGQTFSFSDGLNVIYGANEAGKTTVYHAIGALLFGLEKQTTLEVSMIRVLKEFV